MSTLLEIIHTQCLRTALPVPASVVGSLDIQILQMQALLEEGGESLASRGQWESLTNEASWVTTATESQGPVTTLASNGFNYLLPETLWDRTEMLPLLGPVRGKDWQALKAIVVTGPRYSFRIRKGLFVTTPAPPAGHTWVFEYISKNWILDPDGTTYKAAFTDDDDEILFPANIVKLDLRWRWKKEKGLTYAAEFDETEAAIADALGRDGGKPTLHMDDCGGEIQPGIFVPSGSWPL